MITDVFKLRPRYGEVDQMAMCIMPIMYRIATKLVTNCCVTRVR